MEKTELKARVRDFLNTHRKAVFGTVSLEGRPHTSLMLYVIDDDLNVYFGTRRAFNKYAQIKSQSAISLSVVEETLDPLRVVDLHGHAEELSADETAEWFPYFKKKNPSTYYVEGAEDYVMFRIKPTFVRWLDATSGTLTLNEF